MNRCVSWLLVLGLFAQASAWAAPAMDDDRREALRGYVAIENAGRIDAGRALYELLPSAAQWETDDFAGDGGAAVAPAPDYDTLRAHPETTIGNAFVIEGYFVEQVRFPDPEGGGGEARTRLARAGNPLWGDNLTRWAINTSPDGQDPDQTVLVFFVDPEGEIEAPDKNSRVRVAARFYKAWEVVNQEGEPFEFLTFVGGAREVVTSKNTGSVTSSGFPTWFMPAVVVVAVGLFYGMRYVLNRKGHAALANSEALRDRRRRDRELSEMDEEEDAVDADLPEDPGEALAYLRDRDTD